MTTSKPLSDKDIDLIVWRATRGCHFEGNLLPGSKYVEEIIEQDVPRLVDEIRRQRFVLDQVDAGTKRIDASVDRASSGCVRVAAELERLRTLIVDYASTPMTFAQFLEYAVGEERARQIMGVSDEKIEQWHDRLPGDTHADCQD